MIVYKHHKIESKYKIMNISFVVNMPALLVSESDFVTICLDYLFYNHQIERIYKMIQYGRKDQKNTKGHINLY